MWTTSPTTTDAPPSVVVLDLREAAPDATPRVVTRLTEAKVVTRVLGSEAHDTFAVVFRTRDGTWRFDAGDALSSRPLRTLHVLRRRPGLVEGLDDDFVSVAVGATHMFATPPASGLYPSPSGPALVALCRRAPDGADAHARAHPGVRSPA